MAFIDVVKYQAHDDIFVWKFPSQDLRLGTQLVVNTSQKAFLVKGGKIYDEFGPGTITLKLGNIPLINKIINIPFGGDSPFQAEVWFVNLITKLDNKWGTPIPIQLEDPKYDVIVPVRAFGQFGMSIEDPRKFLESLVGNMTDFSTMKIVDYFKGKLISDFTSALAKKIIIDGISVLQIHLLLDDLSEYCREKIKDEFSKFGIKVENFYIMSINIPEDDPSVVKLKEAKDLAAKVKIAGRDIYQMDRSFDVMDKAAQNEGPAGGLVGLGAGLGLGFGVGNQMGNITKNMNFGQNQAQFSNVPPQPPTESTYYLLVNNTQNGPHTIETVKSLFVQNQINRETYIWKPGLPQWIKLVELEEIREFLNSVPPPPPIPNV